MSAYRFFEDPGHGWLHVPNSELTQLRLNQKISHCSYQDRTGVWLEEDNDMVTFLFAKFRDERAIARFLKDDVRHERSDYDAFIRNLPPYRSWAQRTEP